MGQPTQARRLAAIGGIDRSRTIAFTYAGRVLQGHPGDTLASALLANGISLVGRSFKYRRPRGLFGAGLEDPNSMLSVRDAYGHDPAIRAGQVRLVDGLVAAPVTGWPSPAFDLGAVAQLASRLMPAGFYYKTFKWPTWALFEPVIRRATGFGRPDAVPDRRQARHRHATCDVLIVGAGAAGLAAAQMLRGTGLRVVLADDQPRIGGSLLWEDVRVDGQAGADWARTAAAALADDPDFTVLDSTVVSGAYEHDFFTLVQQLGDDRGVTGECHWKLQARRVILATGLIDRPMLFEGNDRPGIMLASAVRRLVGEFGVAPASRLVVCTNNDGAYATAIRAHRAGMTVVAIVDTRPQQACAQAGAVRELGIACHFDTQVTGTSGYRRLTGVAIRGSDGRSRQLACDGLAVSGGWTPTIHLAAHRGSKPAYDERLGAFVCRQAPQGWHVVGGANGTLAYDALAREVAAAVHAIAPGTGAAPRIEGEGSDGIAPAWLPRDAAPSKVWVDLQNDVKASDVQLAAHENYTSVEHLKRYTTLGMGTDQGRTSNVNGLAILAAATGREVSAVGTTTFRPPYTAVRLGTIADQRQGDQYRPRRYLPADDVHVQAGAVMEDFGWQRADWYRSNGADRDAAIAAEMAAVRGHAGVFDGSSLGKIEVTGPDAAEFLSRFYVSDIRTLKPGRVRYSVMCKEDGVIFDDGVVTCITPHHFLAGPTSGNAEAVAGWFERWRQTEWPGLKVAVTTVTSNWASIAIAGPQAREVLRRLEPDFDVSAQAFPHMGFCEGRVAGLRARVARVSFTGELQYEVSVPARFASALLRELLRVDLAGDGRVPRLVGMEAWLRLRLEKGYIHVGSETNGRVNPLDIGMRVLVEKRKGDFIGRRSLALPFGDSAEREQVVGLRAASGSLQVGGRILAQGCTAPPCPTTGYVTSACFSPSVGQSIALALLERGQSRMDEVVTVYCAGTLVKATVCNPTFHDPDNQRLQA